MSEFMTAFAAEIGEGREKAEAEWLAFSSELMDTTRAAIEERGAEAGTLAGKGFNLMNYRAAGGGHDWRIATTQQISY